MMLPPALLDRARALRAAGYTGKMELDWKDGEVVGWRFSVSERPPPPRVAHETGRQRKTG